MQSSVKSETRHSADLRSLFSTSLHANQEVTVVSSQAPTPAIKRAMYSTMPSIANGHARPQSSPGPATAVAAEAPSNRWNSQSRMSNRSSVRHSSRSFQQNSQDMATLGSNRESMKALSNFLMTNDPPPNNWVSVPSDDERSLEYLKKSPFKLFGSRKSKKPKEPRLLHLPDSAVASKTRSGARHIAISIPIEHDYIENPKPPPLAPSQTRLSLKASIDRPDRSTVNVLKPVAEVRESGSPYLPSPPKMRDSQTELRLIGQGSLTTSPAEALAPETTPTLQHYYTGVDQQQKSPETGSSTPTKPDPELIQRHYFAVSPVSMLRQESQRSDSRYSGATAYSTASLGTWQGHSRGASSTSTAPSATIVSSLKLDLPPRTSSMSKVPTPVKMGFAQSPEFIEEVSEEDPPISSVRSVVSDTATLHGASTPWPPSIFSTAKPDIVRRYSGPEEGGPQVVRSSIPNGLGLTLASSKDLPGPPPAQGTTLSRPMTAPPFQARSAAMAQLKEAEARRVMGGMEDSMRVRRESRQEKVKARKRRDIERLRSKSGTRTPLTEATLTPNTSRYTSPKHIRTTNITTPPRNLRIRSPSQEIARRKAALSVSPIMIVANLAPYNGIVLQSDLASPLTLEKTNSESNSTTIRSPHSSPRSVPHSSPSDSDHVPQPWTRSSRRSRGSVGSKVLSPTGSSTLR